MTPRNVQPSTETLSACDLIVNITTGRFFDHVAEALNVIAQPPWRWSLQGRSEHRPV